MSAAGLNEVLSGDHSIRQLVTNRIYLAPAPQGVASPHIAYEFDSEDPIKDLNGIVSLKREDWNIFVTDVNFTRCIDIKNKITERLSKELDLFTASIQNVDYEFDPAAETHRFEIAATLHY